MTNQNDELLNLPAAILILQDRGLSVSYSSLRQHCLRGTIQATNSNPANPRRGEWLIARSVLATWHPERRGYRKPS